MEIELKKPPPLNFKHYKSEGKFELEEDIRKEVKRHADMLLKHKERFIKAFMAVYGCGPEELEMVTEQSFSENKMVLVTRFRKRGQP